MAFFYLLLTTFIYLTDLILFVPKYTYSKFDHTPRRRKLLYKGVCIFLPWLILTVNMVSLFVKAGVSIEGLLIIAAMTLCAMGDIILEIRFFKGGVLFFFGHMLYAIATVLITKNIKPFSYIIFVMLVAIGTTLTCMRLSKKHRGILIIYNVMISCSFALGTGLIATLDAPLISLGTGVCFLGISDWLLARNKTSGTSYSWSLIALLFYFGGQILVSAFPLLKLIIF